MRNVSVADRPQASWHLHELHADLAIPQRGVWRAENVRQFLRPGSCFYLEAPDVPGRDHVLPPLASALAAKPLLLRMTPVQGEVRTAVPAGDTQTARYFARHRMHAPRYRNKLLASAERALEYTGIWGKPSSSYTSRW